MSVRVTDLIRQHLLQARQVDVHPRMPDLPELRRTESTPLFDRMCLNRMILGAFRYGRLGDPRKPKYDRVASIIERLEAYKRDGNAEHLCDVSNLARLEFVEGEHKGVVAQDDTIHTKVKQ